MWSGRVQNIEIINQMNLEAGTLKIPESFAASVLLIRSPILSCDIIINFLYNVTVQWASPFRCQGRALTALPS